MPMAGDPHEEVRRVLKRLDQFRQGHGILSRRRRIAERIRGRLAAEPPFGLATDLTTAIGTCAAMIMS